MKKMAEMAELDQRERAQREMMQKQDGANLQNGLFDGR